MIITRTPLRISYIGGGSDFFEFTSNQIGNVVGATIDQFVFVVINKLSDIASENLRFTYRQTESVQDFTEIQHPVLKVLAEKLDLRERLNIATFADLPAGAGLGGSSSFTAGLIKAIFEYRGEQISPEMIAEIAIDVERIKLKEGGGIQDQYHASIGGFRHYAFQNGKARFSTPLIPKASLHYLENRQILFWSGESRASSGFAMVTAKKAQSDSLTITAVSQLALKTSERLRLSSSPLEHYSIIAEAVRQGWELKRDFTSQPSKSVEQIVSTSLNCGADAVKLCGAGESGFVLVLAQPESIEKIQNSLSSFKSVVPHFTEYGVTRIL